ncbi:hypothetical protein C5D47_00490 [Rathayibacter toxicus]|uniref:DUF1023 domain-containing protein n=2 Tax=Rathayibacter toxicus TaxID=145458 RepID=A0A2S5YA02_9MICO|nr:hypothetical protein C5D17_00490 [Rathayibacter toxicus]PPH59237.1 hypothetical protein C5D30_00475 [Rathayibacter toxicus]PPH61350.1 hypothetical protein C5C93_00490 [Rathayibacter toxicus]PPH89316.1 hypothetical protein C5D31_00495 [Rathayibacter toxicus]PPI17141.1 hypothetical protein C5C51_00475 [Rathayibacter toxicus]
MAPCGVLLASVMVAHERWSVVAVLAYDDGAAQALVKVLRAADDALRNQTVPRHGAAGYATVDFVGRYRSLFDGVCSTESNNRLLVAKRLSEFADDVEKVTQKAGEERQRQDALAAWEVRQAEREQERQAHPLVLGTEPQSTLLTDPKPSTDPIPRLTVSATCTVMEPARSETTCPVSSPMGGTTSADPERLAVFVSEARALAGDLHEQRDAVMGAWAHFQDVCSWVLVGEMTLLAGLERLIAIATDDADWLERIADAFRAAGGGSLSSQVLDLARTRFSRISDSQLRDALSSLPAQELAAMLKASPNLAAQIQRMPPEVINTWWHTLDPAPESGTQFSPRQHDLITALPVLIGNLEGIPYGARSTANTNHLTETITALTLQRDALRTMPPGSGTGNAVQSTLDGIEHRLKALTDIRDALQMYPTHDQKFLISLTEDDPPLAAISIGDLDTATNVTYAVPGMGQTTEGMTGWTKASQNVQSLLPPGHAVVAWMGYKTPPQIMKNGKPDISVLRVNDAVQGADHLAAALGGLKAVRGDTIGTPNAIGYSYGSTVTALAANRSDVHLGTFVSLGSAGLPDSVHTTADLHADAVYAGQGRVKIPGEKASGDPIAWTGRQFSFDHHVNPMNPDFGAHDFGVENGGGSGRPITEHGALVSDSGERAGYFDQETESLKNTAHAVAGEVDKITSYIPLPPTKNVQKLKDFISSGKM